MSSKPWHGQSVVIVDDSPSVRTELKGLFERIGMKVAGVAENGVVGLELVEKHRPSLVSLDLIMPEMDGVECYRKLRRDHPDVRAIIVSWLGSEAKIIDNLKDVIPAHLFQAKPVTAEALQARLDRVYDLAPVTQLPTPGPIVDPSAAGSPLTGYTVKVS